MTADMEIKMLNKLREHLRIAEARHWNIDKLIFIDGFLQALNMATGKTYGFSGVDVYLTDNNGRHLVKNGIK